MIKICIKLCFILLGVSFFSFIAESKEAPKLNKTRIKYNNPESGADTTKLHKVRIKRHQKVTMRDGTILYADLYLPLKPGKYPTILSRTPYGVRRNAGIPEDYIKFAQHGYAVVYQDVRGRFESEGDWEPFRNEAKDGYDTIEWAASQPWSNGKVATEGGSYLGQNQWAAAMENPPHLVAAAPFFASTNIYANWITMGGAFRLSFNYGWGVVRMPNRIMLPQYWHTAEFVPERLKYANILRYLPLKEGDVTGSGYKVQHYRDWVKHESLDKYWQAVNFETQFNKITIPTFSMGGFYDIFNQGEINGYVGMKNHGGTKKAREGAHLIMGPWEHGSSEKAGGFDFTPKAHLNEFNLLLRFYDHYLKGIENGLNDEKPVRIFYTGVNKWRSEDDYPIPKTKYRHLYLSSDSGANSVRGDGTLTFNAPDEGGVDTYRYDPLNPVPTLGGNNCCGTPTISGPRDQRPHERRHDVLVYTSDYLQKPLTIAGPINMKLFAATDGRDTDWMIKLMDVHPDGTSREISEGILRAKFRNGLDKINLLAPGKVYEFDIKFTHTANVFLPGHRIRVDITSSNFPQFNRNLNTGAALGTSTKTRVAEQTIHYGGTQASYIVLPSVPTLTDISNGE